MKNDVISIFVKVPHMTAAVLCVYILFRACSLSRTQTQTDNTVHELTRENQLIPV